MNTSTRSPLCVARELAEGRGHVLASNGAIAGLVNFYRPLARGAVAREVATTPRRAREVPTPPQRAEFGGAGAAGGAGSTKKGNNTRSACETGLGGVRHARGAWPIAPFSIEVYNVSDVCSGAWNPCSAFTTRVSVWERAGRASPGLTRPVSAIFSPSW